MISAMENLRSSVTSIRVPEVTADFLRPALGAPQEAPHVSYQRLFVTGAFPSHGVGLDVLVQKLVRVELGAVPGRKNEANLPPMPLHSPLGVRSTCSTRVGPIEISLGDFRRISLDSSVFIP